MRTIVALVTSALAFSACAPSSGAGGPPSSPTPGGSSQPAGPPLRPNAAGAEVFCCQKLSPYVRQCSPASEVTCGDERFARSTAYCFQTTVHGVRQSMCAASSPECDKWQQSNTSDAATNTSPCYEARPDEYVSDYGGGS